MPDNRALYEPMARKVARRVGINPDIFVRQIDQESGWNPTARSGAGAIGIAQIVPKYHPNVDPTDPAASLTYAATWMAHLLQQYGGDWSKALAVYNGGVGALQQLQAGRPYDETRQYLTSILGGLGPRTAEAAEIGDAGVDTHGDRPASEFDQPAQVPSSADSRRIAGQLSEARTRLTTAQETLAKARAVPDPEPFDAEVLTPSQRATATRERDKAIRARDKAINDAERDAERADAEIKRLEKEAAAEEDRLAREAAKPPPKPAARPRVKARDGSVWEQQPSGEWEQIEEIPTGAPTKAPTVTTPKASRTYKAGGATYTETAPDVGGFQPLPAGVADPDAMTPYQTSQLPIQQQNADTSRLSAAASMLHAQVAQGTLDANSAIQVFNYVKAQGAPVEEGGKLYNAGFSPSNPVRQHFRLDPEPYAVQDLAGMLGRSDLNQFIRGPHPFGGGPMSPQEYQQRQAGTFQGGPSQAPAPPPMAAQALAPPMPAPSSAGTMLAADQGGFSPQPAPPPPPPQTAAAPQFGAPPQQQNEQGLMASLAKIRATLVQKGIDPAVAEQAARDFLKIPEPAGLGGVQ